MPNDIELNYDELPAIAPSYLRAAATLSGGLDEGETIPPISAHLKGLEVQPSNLARYREVCVFARTEYLPVTYPHVLAFPLHMAVLTHKRFPLKLLGLIHVRNNITQHRLIKNDETLNLAVRVGGHRDVRQGIEFDLITEVHDNAGDLLWEETGTMLSRRSDGQKKSEDQKKARDRPSFTTGQYANWDVAADIGRRYAGAAGDYNPIHLSAYSAKLFGFPRAIATGMWLKARAAAELVPQLEQSAYTLRVEFKKPVFLPSPVVFKYHMNPKGADFALTDPDGDTLHLQGDVAYLQESAR